MSATRATGGAWQPTVDITGEGIDLEADISAGGDTLAGGHPVAVAAEGEAVVVWTAAGDAV